MCGDDEARNKVELQKLNHVKARKEKKEKVGEFVWLNCNQQQHFLDKIKILGFG